MWKICLFLSVKETAGLNWFFLMTSTHTAHPYPNTDEDEEFPRVNVGWCECLGELQGVWRAQNKTFLNLNLQWRKDMCGPGYSGAAQSEHSSKHHPFQKKKKTTKKQKNKTKCKIFPASTLQKDLAFLESSHHKWNIFEFGWWECTHTHTHTHLIINSGSDWRGVSNKKRHVGF